MNDYLIFVFKGGKHFYLVTSEREEDAWKDLCKRQSCRLEICKQQYKLIYCLNGNDNIIKL